MKQTIRAFAIGLFAAGIIMLIVNYFSSSEVQDLSEMPIDDVIKELKDEGYRVLTETDYITLSMTADAEKAEAVEKEKADEIASLDSDTSQQEETTEKEDTIKEDTKKEEQADESNNQKEQVKTYTLTVEAGMAPVTISKKLAENGIVDNADKFVLFLGQNGYDVKIQQGQFKLTSDMSYTDVAEALTR